MVFTCQSRLVLQRHTFIIFLANKSKFLRSKINILSCLHSNARFIRGKSWKIRLFPKPVSKIAKTSILPTRCFKTVSLLFAFSLHVWKVTQRCVCCEFEFCVTGCRVCHHRHIAFLSVFEDAPLLTKAVEINQSEGIPGSGIPERTFVKNSYKRSRTSLPSPPLLFIAFSKVYNISSPLSLMFGSAFWCRSKIIQTIDYPSFETQD